MEPVVHHIYQPDTSFDGGDLNCGNGLLLLIRKHIDPLNFGQLLEVRSTDDTVDEDLPAWCRMTRNELISWTKQGEQRSFLICKGEFVQCHTDSGDKQSVSTPSTSFTSAISSTPPPVSSIASATPKTAQSHMKYKPLPLLPVTGMGSWPRPRWMVEAMHQYVQGRMSEAVFQETADDAVRLIVDAQQRAGATLFTDGEQRRDSYASFVATRLENCQLVPLTDLLPLIEDPAAFEAELRALDVPANEVRHPGVFGRISRKRPLAVHEFQFLSHIVDAPTKVALPGPYLLTRTMWMECIAENVYASRDEIAADIVQVLREEISELLAAGVTLIQIDEPVLSEVVFSGAKKKRSFMCGALSESNDPEFELGFAKDLVNAVIQGMPRERIALHVCRGNWTPDESVALSGSYEPLLPTLAGMKVGAYMLETCTPRAGDIALLKALPEDARIGVGVVNQKIQQIESVDDVAARISQAIDLFGKDRLLLHPDCGFATFADNPICSMQIAEGKLHAIAQAAQRFL